MFIALIHWRIKPDEDSKKAFLEHWNTRNSISNRSGLIAEFVSDTPDRSPRMTHLYSPKMTLS